PAGFSSYDCNREYYPSEMDGRFFATISYNTYVCESTYQGDECYGPYYSGHPEAVIGWTPDYYCNWRGCSPYGYP
ncbi:MAG: hypothetical protein R3324_00640, partial [Halobacteriales archaeon]|nr:hypothetical protein [Halobacteriales archaeon]